MFLLQDNDEIDLSLHDMSLEELVGRLFTLILIKEKIEATAACCGFLGCFIPILYFICLFLDLLDANELSGIGMLVIGIFVIALVAVSVFSVLCSIYVRDKIKKTEYYITILKSNNYN